MKTPATILFSLLAVLLVAFATPASANLVNNGGFETGDFTGWINAGNTGFTGVDGNPHSGNNAAFLGPVGSTGNLEQALTTTAGAFYNLSFFLSGGNNPNVFGQPTDFRILWNGVQIFDASAVGNAYTQFTFLVQATGASTNLEFVYRNDSGLFFLDDVSVELAQGSSVPETFSTLWLALPLIGMVGFSRLRRKELSPVCS